MTVEITAADKHLLKSIEPRLESGLGAIQEYYSSPDNQPVLHD
jgi:hypothetical protein